MRFIHLKFLWITEIKSNLSQTQHVLFDGFTLTNFNNKRIFHIPIKNIEHVCVSVCVCVTYITNRIIPLKQRLYYKPMK